ncbi:RNA polymerase sigma factor [Nocardiopsis lambiniae]|uniref:Sigma-70 family RNA polymerase sigma factor n=1 Tax=Nocardiopsis lambiniae TaxID=3075539 RepID=A0ABU2M7J9_9ACTN|nr:sigma-70 family RNA polymerase sigma factor [Nocardiopsis sp. DSM 44743]MDT0328643.1 sigma-70 family RNA polymerase sigma factor [Nocardiopsis sp. DSM 44743]
MRTDRAEAPPTDRLADLYDRYHARILAFCLLRSDESVAEEVASETFVIAWRRLSTVPDPPLPWLLGVARNLLRKQYGARMRRETLLRRLAELTNDRDQRDWDVAERFVLRESAVRALSELPERHVEALTLVAWHGLSPTEAGKVVGCSATTFSVRLHRARRALARQLDVLEGSRGRKASDGRPPEPRSGHPTVRNVHQEAR